MAIDTAQKRASVATIATVWNGPSIIPSGAFPQAARQHVGWSYTGILAAAAVAVARILTLPDRGFGLALPVRGFGLTLPDRDFDLRFPS